MLKEFFTRVWGSSVGWAFIAFRKDDGKGLTTLAYRYPGQLNELLHMISNSSRTTDVYFCPHLFTAQSRTKDKAVTEIKWLWVDKDSGQLDDLKPKPTICWETSGGRYAALWELDRMYPSAQVEQANRQLAYATKSDKGGWDLTQLLRVPESINYKYTPTFQGRLLWMDTTTYPIDSVVAPKEELVSEAKQLLDDIESKRMPSNIPSFQEVALRYGTKIPPKAWEILQAVPVVGEDWSGTLWKLECLLFDNGIPAEAVFTLAKNSPYNKYARDNRPDQHLWEEVLKAKSERTAIVTKSQTPRGLNWMGLNQIMAISERPEWLVKDVWMEKNVGWIAGVGKSYKSTISLDLALSIASGEPFLDTFEVMNPGPVLMIQEEDPAWRVAHRLQVMTRGKGINQIEYREENNKIIMEMPADREIPLFVSIAGGFTLTDKDSVRLLEEALQQFRPRMLFLDPTFMLLPGVDEFKAGDVTGVLNLLKYWRNEYDCAIALVHHYNKGSGKGNSRLYGSMAFYAWSENSMFVDRIADTNRISIERDVKDALVSTPLEVEFYDIDKEYDFQVLQVSPTTRSAEGAGGQGKYVPSLAKNKVTRFLQGLLPDTIISRRDVSKNTGISEKTVSRVVKELETLKFVVLSKSGQGDALSITPTNALFLFQIPKLSKEEVIPDDEYFFGL